MFGELVEALKSAPAAYAAGAAVVAAILKTAKSILQFHDRYFRRRPFERLSFLAGECAENEALSGLIASAKNELVFREVLDATGSPKFIAAVHCLLQSGRFSIAELRSAAFHLRLCGDELVVKLGIGAVVLFWVPLLLILSMGISVGVTIVNLLALKSLIGTLAAAAFFIIFLLFARLVGRDARAVCAARSVARKLNALRLEG